jgi:23S rRNA pseudouridine1911/1915/1917 synthase
MVVAKNDKAHEILAGQFKGGGVRKEYVALVHKGPKETEGTIDLPIGRHPIHRKKMAVVEVTGKRAVTLWRVQERYGLLFSLLDVRLKTGRTHQIRVHLSHAGYPIVGDPVYGPGRLWWKRNFPGHETLPVLIERQMLHAARLAFVHPVNGKLCSFEAPVPEDMVKVLETVKAIVAADNNT